MTAAEVAPGVLVTTSRRYATTSTVVVHGNEALLVDPAWDPDELDAIADLLDERDLRVVAGVATHAHHDHVLWHPRFGTAPRYGSKRTVELPTEHRDDLVASLGDGWPPELAAARGTFEPAPDRLTGWDEPIELVVHDGHAPGHTAVWLPARGVLLAGDMLSDVELPLPLAPDDLPAYLGGLDVLAPYVARAAVLVPGHGTSDRESPATAGRRPSVISTPCTQGGEPDDPRRANDGMAEVHEQIKAML